MVMEQEEIKHITLLLSSHRIFFGMIFIEELIFLHIWYYMVMGLKKEWGWINIDLIFFTFLGLSLSLTAKDFNQFLYFSPIILLIFGLPIIQFLGFFNYPIINIIPSWSALMVIDGAVRGSLSINMLLQFAVFPRKWEKRY
jgi:fluoroquinolone transport system permease protein